MDIVLVPVVIIINYLCIPVVDFRLLSVIAYIACHSAYSSCTKLVVISLSILLFPFMPHLSVVLSHCYHPFTICI